MIPKALILTVLSVFTMRRNFTAANTDYFPELKDFTGVLSEPCGNRTVWDSLYISNSLLQTAQETRQTTMPVWDDEVYLLFHTKGDRSGQRMMWARQDRLSYLVLGECASYDGSFLEVIESDLLSLSTQKSWALPSADWQLTYFDGTEYFVELNSATMAADLGLALYLLGDLINATVRQIVTDALNVRVFQPLKNAIQNGPPPSMWWMRKPTNWNAVCWAGMMVAVSCALEDVNDRSYITTYAITHSTNYINSFQDDGFASEGVGYYNYGFTNYAVLRQVLYEGSNGEYDSFSQAKVSKSALFAKEYGMSSGNVANFGDSHFEKAFDKELEQIIDLSFQEVGHYQDVLFNVDTVDAIDNQTVDDENWDQWIWEKKASLTPNYYDDDHSESFNETFEFYYWEKYFDAAMDFEEIQSRESIHQSAINLPWYLLQKFTNRVPRMNQVSTSGMNDLRRYYDESGVLVARPSDLNDGIGLAATFKLGGNKGTHSHDDIGSYVISLNSIQLTGDPGGPLYYDANSFNQKRYLSPLMNSYGHPVPVVNGKLQKRAALALRKSRKPNVVSTSFTDSTDAIVFDMTSAYDEPYLEKLTRQQSFDRISNRIVITDSIVFSKPCMFEDALITQKDWKFTGNDTGYFFDASNILYVEISSSSPSFIWNVTNLSSYGVNFKRIGIYILEPILRATVSIVFYPAS